MSSTYSWVLLFIAGLFEIAWTIAMKYSQGLTKPLPTFITATCLALSMYLLAKAVSILPLGTAYAIWVGIGSLGAAIFGIILFKESASLPRMFFLALLLISIIGLKVTAE